MEDEGRWGPLECSSGVVYCFIVDGCADMVKTVKIQLPGDRQIQMEYPDSPLMEKVIREVFIGSEYPLIPFLNPAGAAVVDIGANIGCSTVLFATQYPAATVFALEPSADAFAFLARNVSALGNVRPIHVGAFDKDISAPFFPGQFASVTGSLFPGGEASNVLTETVRLRRISTLLDELGIGRIALLKIDTEGAEVPILGDLLLRMGGIDAIYVEFHSEDDRHAIDRLLAPQFILSFARVNLAHRGICGYIARRVISAHTQWDRIPIRHGSP